MMRIGGDKTERATLGESDNQKDLTRSRSLSLSLFFPACTVSPRGQDVCVNRLPTPPAPLSCPSFCPSIVIHTVLASKESDCSQLAAGHYEPHITEQCSVIFLCLNVYF